MPFVVTTAAVKPPVPSSLDTLYTLPLRVVSGHVRSPQGLLPGAVVRVQGLAQPVVTNANGEFRVSVPAGTEPLRLTASYAGFLDETTVLATTNEPVTVALLRPQLIKTTRKQRLKVYMKTARRQAKRSLRHL